MLTAAQCRAARGLLQITQRDVAEMSGLTVPTICRWEREYTSMHPNNVELIKRAFESRGVAFIGSVGVTFRADVPPVPEWIAWTENP